MKIKYLLKICLTGIVTMQLLSSCTICTYPYSDRTYEKVDLTKQVKGTSETNRNQSILTKNKEI